MIKLSIIIPSYNQCEFLSEAIESVLNQSYECIECIVIDGGSTDGSIEVIQDFQDNLYYWISEKDGGQADAIVKGFRYSTGEYISWLNSDDILYSDTVEKMVNFISKYPDVDLFYGNVHYGYDLSHSSLLFGRQTSFKEMIMSYNVPIPQQGSFISRRIIDKIGFLNTEWHYVLDRELFLRISLYSKIKYLPETLGFFRFHTQSKSLNRQFTDKWCKEICLLYEKIAYEWDLSSLNISTKYILSLAYLACSSRCLRSNMPKACLYFVYKSLLTAPQFVCKNLLNRLNV